MHSTTLNKSRASTARIPGRSATLHTTLNTKKRLGASKKVKPPKRKFSTSRNPGLNPSPHSPLLTSTQRSIYTSAADDETIPIHSHSSSKNDCTTLPTLSPTWTTSQLINHFRDLALAANTADSFHHLNQQFNLLRSDAEMLKAFPRVPPVVYSAMLEANLASNNFAQTHHILAESLIHQVRLPPNSLISTFRKLSLNGHVGYLEDTMKILMDDVDRINNTTKTNNTSNNNKKGSQNRLSRPHQDDGGRTTDDNQPINLSNSSLVDPHTATQLKESLVLCYVNQSQLQQSVHALMRHFGPGSGSIPSDNVLEVIVQNLLKYRRPRHAHQLVTKFDVYCTPKMKSKLYSKIALSFLETDMTEQLNQTLAYMEQNEISPHPSMMESLLAHIIQTNSPNISLRWYNQIYPHNSSLFHQSGSASTLPDDQQNNGSVLSPKTGFNLKAANTIVKALFAVNHHHQSLEFLQGLPIHTSTVNILLKAHYDSRDWDSLRLTLKYMLLRGLPLDQHGLHILIQSLAYHTHPAALTALLDSLTLKQQLRLHPMTYNFFIRSLKTQGYPKLCEQVLARMRALGETPDQSTHNLVIHAYLEQGMARDAYRLKDSMVAAGLQPNLATYSLFFDSLIQSGDALALYHALTEVFDRADVLITAGQANNWHGGHDDGDNNGSEQRNPEPNQAVLSTFVDFDTLPQTFPKTREMLKQTQNDPTFTEKQRFLTYLRSYIKAACHLLSTSGYKHYSDTLSSFYLSQGGATVNSKLASLPFNRKQQHLAAANRMGRGNSANIAASQLAMNPQLAFKQVNPSSFLQGSEAFGSLDNDDVGEVLSSLAREGQSDNDGEQQKQRRIHTSRQHDPFQQQQQQQQLHDVHQNDLENDPDAMYERLNNAFGLEKKNKATEEDKEKVQVAANASPIGFTVEQSDLIINQVLRAHHFSPNHRNRGTGDDGVGIDGSGGSDPNSYLVSGEGKMFDVRRLHALPANSLNDYIDRADTAMMQLQQDRVLRCQYQGLVGRFDKQNRPMYFQNTGTFNGVQINKDSDDNNNNNHNNNNNDNNNDDNNDNNNDDSRGTNSNNNNNNNTNTNNRNNNNNSNTNASSSTSAAPVVTVGQTINYGWGKHSADVKSHTHYNSSYKLPSFGGRGNNFDKDKISPYSTTVTTSMRERDTSGDNENKQDMDDDAIPLNVDHTHKQHTNNRGSSGGGQSGQGGKGGKQSRNKDRSRSSQQRMYTTLLGTDLSRSYMM